MFLLSWDITTKTNGGTQVPTLLILVQCKASVNYSMYKGPNKPLNVHSHANNPLYSDLPDSQMRFPNLWKRLNSQVKALISKATIK